MRHAEIKTVMRDPATYSSYARATQIIDPPDQAALDFVREMMLNQDPPRHSRLRKMLTRAFTPKAIARLEDRIAAWARELVDRVAADGECDFAELAADLPLQTLAEIFGVPQQDRWLMYDWSNRVIGYQDQEYARSAKASADGSTDDGAAGDGVAAGSRTRTACCPTSGPARACRTSTRTRTTSPSTSAASRATT